MKPLHSGGLGKGERTLRSYSVIAATVTFSTSFTAKKRLV